MTLLRVPERLSVYAIWMASHNASIICSFGQANFPFDSEDLEEVVLCQGFTMVVAATKMHTSNQRAINGLGGMWSQNRTFG